MAAHLETLIRTSPYSPGEHGSITRSVRYMGI